MVATREKKQKRQNAPKGLGAPLDPGSQVSEYDYVRGFTRVTAIRERGGTSWELP
jgi:hypothetical protein